MSRRATAEKTPALSARSYRFSPQDVALMDALGERLALPGLGRLSRTDVLRLALRRLAEAELPSRKNSRKSGQ